MNRTRMILRSLIHYLPRHLLVALGVALSTAILTGALFIGDSMRYSLEQITLSRLGNTTHLLSVTDRYFRADLATEMNRGTGITAVPLLLLDGMAVADGGENRVNHLMVNGIDDRFREIYPGIPLPEGDQVVISANVALQLGVSTGDPLLVRITKATLMPRNTPFVSENDQTVTLRATVAAILPPEGAGLFNLRNAQTTPRNLFLSLHRLNTLMDLNGRANRILFASQNSSSLSSGGSMTTSQLDSLLRLYLTPADAGLQIREIAAAGEWDITSERIFLEPEISTAFSALPGSRPILTYFVNTIATTRKEVPYSFAASLPGTQLAKGDLIVNEWVAADLEGAVGDSVTLTWFEIGPLRQLEEKSRRFRMAAVVPLSGSWADSTLMPAIPGMADAGHCREWEAGVPIDLDKIRPRDEAYWNRYRGTPKIFVAHELAHEIWANRFGSTTAIRLPRDRFSPTAFMTTFREKISPAALGFSLSEVRASGLASARGGVDFGQLFLGLSFFLLLAALLLTALLFRFNLENRTSQVGTLLQLGFTPRRVTSLLLSETALVALAGVAAGLLLAVGYVQIIFSFLNTLWWDIVRTPVIFLNIKSTTLITGALVSFAVALLSMAIPLRKTLRQSVADLHHQREISSAFGRSPLKRWIPWLLSLPALGLVALQLSGLIPADPLLFFLAGGALLAGLVATFSQLLAIPAPEETIPQRDTSQMNPLLVESQQMESPRMEFPQMESAPGELPQGAFPGMTLPKMLLRQAARNRRRSISVFLLFALGTFIVVATGANRRNLYSRAADPSSGTGGFTAWTELAVPLLYDLNDSARRAKEGITTSFRVVPFARVEGDDASCLNLHKVENPSILGVDPSLLEGRFSFVSHTDGLDPRNPWSSLRDTLPGDVVPGIADQTVIQWGLMMKIGDTLFYQGERGDTLRIKLVGGLAPSLFQGSVLIADTHLYRYFPTHSGSHVLLTQCTPGEEETAGEEIRDLLRDHGIEMTPAARRLAEFNSVTNTYLAIFLALGLLGLLLGTLGLALVLARSVLERRSELATLLALGFRRNRVVALLMGEYLFLLTTGTLSGFLAATLAVIPSLTGSHNPVSAENVALLILMILVNGAAWIFLLARLLVTPSRLLPALRDL